MTTDAPRAPGAGACPAPEQLAAYVEGALRESERTMVEQHLVDCPDCRDIVGSAAAMPAVAAAAIPRSGRSRWVPIAAGLVASAALITIAIGLRTAFTRRDAMASVIAAAGSQRLIEPRLSGGFAHAPLSVRRGTVTTDQTDLQLAAAQIRKQLQSERSPALLRADGSARLLLGDTEGAIVSLTEAARADSRSPEAASDLAAALIVRGSAADHPADFVAALDALRRFPDASLSAEALFNKALALERLKLREQAVEAWRAYLLRDPGSAWADEARRHLEDLSRQSGSWNGARPQLALALQTNDRAAVERIARSFPTAVRENLEDRLLPAWAASCRHACDDGALRRAMLMADALAAAGDPMDAETVHALRASPAALDGIEAFGRARGDFVASRFEAATAGFSRAARQLASARLPLALHSRYYVYVMEYRSGALGTARAGLETLAATAALRRYAAIEGKAHWALGLIGGATGNYADALYHYRSASAAFARIGDTHNVGNVHTLVAEALDLLGQTDAGWRERIAGLSRLDPGIDRRRWNAALLLTASAANAAGAPRAAAAFATAIVAHTDHNEATDVAEAYVSRAASLFEVGDYEPAVADLNRARATLTSIQGQWAAERLGIEADIVEAQAFTTSDPQRAIVRFRTALSYFNKVGPLRRTAEIHLGLSRAHEARDEIESAVADLASGIDAFERIRGTLESEELRISFFDRSWSLFDDMTRLQIARNDSDAAFAYAERGRARALLDAWQFPASALPRSAAAVAARLPTDVSVVSFTEAGAWIINRAASRFIHRKADFALAPMLAALHGALQTGADIRPLAEMLYDTIWEPVRAQVPSGDRLAIIPSRGLQGLPFAALRNSRTGRWLIEDHDIVVAPSVAMLLTTSARLVPARSSFSALVAGAAGIRRADISLPPLKYVQTEIDSITRVYPRARVIANAALTPAAFLAALDEHDVVHFAGHALMNGRYPFYSRLVLDGDAAGRAMDLTAADIGRVRVSRPRLVVLSACRSAAGTASGDGVLSLARPFLAAGVPVVVGSMWDVDDSAAASLMADFHRRYAAGGDAAGALRGAQLRALRSGDPRDAPPAAWAGFSVIGGMATSHASQEVP